jgi:rubrerythrin/uncharacterized membrane protein
LAAALQAAEHPDKSHLILSLRRLARPDLQDWIFAHWTGKCVSVSGGNQKPPFIDIPERRAGDSGGFHFYNNLRKERPMSSWECGVCGYIHNDAEPPEKCPICDAPKKMFTRQESAEPSDEKAATPPPAEQEKKKWRCTVCGYEVVDVAPPEKCPVCEAAKEMFAEAKEEPAAPPAPAPSEKRWRCTVCGYVHSGGEPPEKCPVCAAPKKMFVEIDADGKALTEVEQEVVPAAADNTAAPAKKTMGSRLAGLVLSLHLHPITVHFPNGILPLVLILLGIAVYFQAQSLEVAAFYNLIFVLLTLPLVLLTGFVEWQKRYKGVKTWIFIVKIICAIVVLGLVNVLVFWRILDPQVASAGSPWQMIYLGLAGGVLVAAGLAGHLGGKLVFGGRS